MTKQIIDTASLVAAFQAKGGEISKAQNGSRSIFAVLIKIEDPQNSKGRSMGKLLTVRHIDRTGAEAGMPEYYKIHSAAEFAEDIKIGKAYHFPVTLHRSLAFQDQNVLFRLWRKPGTTESNDPQPTPK